MLVSLALAVAAAPLQDLPFELVVQDPSGVPVVGARVVLTHRADWAYDPPVLLLEGPTDDEGRFEVGLPREWVESPRSEFLGIAVLAEDGVVLDELPLDQVPVGAALEWTLERHAPWSLAIQGADGEPVGGATVSVCLQQTSTGHVTKVPGLLGGQLEAVTDEAGAARMVGVRRSTVRGLSIELPSGVFVHHHVAELFDGPLVLAELGLITLALDAEADPALEGHTIDMETTHRRDWSDARAPVQTVVSRALIPAPGQSVEVQVASGVTSGARFATAWDVPATLLIPNHTTDMALELGSTYTLRSRAKLTMVGRVVDASGAGIANARLLVKSHPVRRWVTTDSDGHYSFAAKSGHAQVEAVIPPWPRVGLTKPAMRDGRWVSVGSEYEVPPFVLPDASPVAGRVLRADGTPAPGALVTLRAEADDGQGVYRSAVSEADGTFVVHVPVGSAAELTARFGWELTADPIPADDGVELRLSPSGSLRKD